MILRFLKDYRSRAWMCRYAAGAVVEVTNPEVVQESLAGGFAEAVTDEPSVDALTPPAVVEDAAEAEADGK